MLYEKVTKRCSAVRLSKTEARASLERQFTGSEILDLHRRGDKWVATLLMPKEAEFPPKKDDDEGGSKDDGGAEKSESKDDSSDSDSGEDSGPPKADKPPVPGEEAKGGGLEHTITELTTLVHAIADAMGISPGPAVPGADDPMAGPPGPDAPPAGPPGGAPGGPPAGGPPGAPQKVVHERALKPGEAAPGTTPIGAPAFSSVQASQLGRLASFDAFDDTPGKSIKEAKEELEAMYGPHGFKVRQIKRVENGTRLAAKLSRR